ncbi:ATP-binding cassette domain-containing protein [Thermomonospora cellulosilytica]|uniref:ABC-2 type transport system ATP-binding protein n=1 Tax=Thermomonospora cellulosilytica TaxID=1411118 RepID=A0A7W3N1G3_9ACTN|nr:ATP-binding cassette domain-containing protein [Thermomonospora cellulosilytica]MBA9005765.1 ABC-2 type transport system ATP-binding protein [Thermomonospora cellulosilytica]
MIEAEGLRKRFGRTVALAGVDLRVGRGAVCGLLGPNGAGKTTVVRILATLLRPDGGRARVAGRDVAADPAGVRGRIGLAGQHPTVDEILTGRENLRLWARLHHLGAAEARRRADELLERFGLADAADRRVRHYSGGMRRRLDLAAAFLRAPRVLFLDEPTTGLDPRSRDQVWRAVRQMAADGTTVLLTTQYLEEADRLAHQIVVLEGGRVIADDTPARLKDRLGGDRVDVVVAEADRLGDAAAVLSRVAGAPAAVDAAARRVGVPVRDRIGTLIAAARELRGAGVAVEDLQLRRPTLDEVFLHLTGRTGTRS